MGSRWSVQPICPISSSATPGPTWIKGILVMRSAIRATQRRRKLYRCDRVVRAGGQHRRLYPLCAPVGAGRVRGPGIERDKTLDLGLEMSARSP
jgi:hypothetical protein